MLKSSIRTCSLLLVSLIIFTSCGGTGKKEVKEAAQKPDMIEVTINGMTCTGCENTIQTNLAKVPGIVSVKASYTVGNAIVEYFPAKVDTTKIKEVVNGLGYTAVRVMPHQGMTGDQPDN